MARLRMRPHATGARHSLAAAPARFTVDDLTVKARAMTGAAGLPPDTCEKLPESDDASHAQRRHAELVAEHYAAAGASVTVGAVAGGVIGEFAAIASSRASAAMLTAKENAMSQSHLVVDFPIKGAAIAKALPEELPPLMPDLARAQDDLGTVHYSRFMVEGDEKLLFLSDIDGEADEHIERLVERAGPVLDAIFEYVDNPPPTPLADDPEQVVKWLKRHVREPMDTYFAYADASVQDIKECARAAGFTGSTAQGNLLTYMTFKSRAQGFAVKHLAKALMADKGHKGADAIGTLHVAHWVPFEHNHMGFFTIFDGDFEKYIQDFADKTSFTFDALFPRVIGGAPTPVEKNAQAFYQWGLDNNYPPIGFYSAYPGLSVQDIRALLADYGKSSSARAEQH